jgi:pimeloyl-ACP methyl ester carboxylesterase
LTNPDVAYGQATLPSGIRSRFVDTHTGVTLHVLEAGSAEADRPCVVLLHGFPELAYSWRRILLPLAEAGFYVIAPDLRGYGRSGGTDVTFDDDLRPFSLFNHVADVLGLVFALGKRPWPPWSGTTTAHRSPPGAPWRGRTFFSRSR